MVFALSNGVLWNNRNLEEYSWEYFAVTVTKED